jgi:hypothetical protein
LLALREFCLCAQGKRAGVGRTPLRPNWEFSVAFALSKRAKPVRVSRGETVMFGCVWLRSSHRCKTPLSQPSMLQTSPLRRVAVPTMKLIAGNLDNSMFWQPQKWLARRLLFPKANVSRRRRGERLMTYA